jgi:outer membrane protein OmpA-like peptidoglycan-associated protein/opacity protein-like surface antigen
MRFATRIIATTALAFLLVPALWADETAKPEAAAKKDEAVTSRVAPAKAESSETLATTVAHPHATPRPQPHAAHGSMGRSAKHGRRSRQGGGTPKVELFMGYSYWRAVPYSLSNRIESMNGGSTSLAYNFNSHWGLVADFAGFKVDSLKFSAGPGTTPSRLVDVQGNVFSVLFGPRLSFRNHGRFTPFLQVLGGAAHADEVTLVGCTAPIYACTPLPRETVFALTAGGGLDYRVNHRVALRLFQVEYLMTRFANPNSPTYDKVFQNNVRLSAGIVFRFGGSVPPPPPNRSPVASCSADKNAVYLGSGDMAVVHVDASDPDNDPLTYSWTASGGAADGSGPDARWNSSGATLGTYTVKVRVDDGRGGTADCSVDIRVERPPNRPPTVTCSTDRTPILQGESSGITAYASDPDNDPLTYSYSTTGGRIAGSGPKVRFDSTGLPPGIYAVKCRVSDDRGGTADASANVDVQSPPPPPEIHELEVRLALRSIYFPTARPSAANPGGGLVDSQEKILTSLVSDFKRYLTFRPEAHLILGGHADVRGSVEYNKALTERRVERTKHFLVEHGVSAGSIEVRSFGKEDELNAEQVEEQMKENPDLSPDDRQKMLNNLPVLVLANNRRVDVSLSTTGQQSVRRYPFNARDALALISAQGGEKQAAARKRVKKQ